MATPSSLTTALRALVMLVCLTIVPLAAIFGTSLPDVAKRFLAARLGTQQATAQDPSTAAPPYRAPVAEPPAPASRPFNRDAAPGAAAPPVVLAASDPAPRFAPPPPVPPPPAGEERAAPAGYNEVRPLPPAPAQHVENAPSTRLPESSRHAPRDDPESSRHAPRDEAPPDARQAGPAADRFAYGLQRLRELGASYYRLESWGNQKNIYHFYCKMAIGGNPEYARLFEAIDADPMQAIAKVIDQVEAWRAGG